MPTIKVMSAGAVESVLIAVGGEFERASGDTVECVFNTAGAVRARFLAGEIPDLLVLPAAGMQALEEAGQLKAGSRLDLAQSATGVAVRQGAPHPDISTPDAFKRALLAAQSIAYTDPASGGSSGTFFAGLLERLAVAEAVAPKAVLGKRGADVAARWRRVGPLWAAPSSVRCCRSPGSKSSARCRAICISPTSIRRVSRPARRRRMRPRVCLPL